MQTPVKSRPLGIVGCRRYAPVALQETPKSEAILGWPVVTLRHGELRKSGYPRGSRQRASDGPQKATGVQEYHRSDISGRKRCHRVHESGDERIGSISSRPGFNPALCGHVWMKVGALWAMSEVVAPTRCRQALSSCVVVAPVLSTQAMHHTQYSRLQQRLLERLPSG